MMTIQKSQEYEDKMLRILKSLNKKQMFQGCFSKELGMT